MIRIEEGKYYVSKCGQLHGPMILDRDPMYFRAQCNGYRLWRDTGVRYNTNYTHPDTLVQEYVPDLGSVEEYL